MSQPPNLHGRDHGRRPGKTPDPIPQDTSWAWIGRTTSQTFTTGTPTQPDFTSGDTNDLDVFNVDQANNRIEFLATGIYVVEFDMVASVSGFAWQLRLICNASSPMSAGVDLPEEHRHGAATGFPSPDPYFHAGAVMFVNNLTDFTPTEVHGVIQQNSGADRSVGKSMIRVFRQGDFP